jgi:hypothetical protein
MKLPNAEKAFIDIEKLSGYCLNPNHDQGKHKARLFSSISGLTENDAERLKKKLLKVAADYEAEPDGEDQYGKRYIIDFRMKTIKGQATVHTSWILRKNENFVRLTSCYILKKKDEYHE